MLTTSIIVNMPASMWGSVKGGCKELSLITGRLRRMFTPMTRVNRMIIPMHRFCGLAFLVQLVVSFVLYMIDFRLFMRTPLWFTLPMSGSIQAISAGYYFRYTTPKKADPGFMSMGDVGRLSWFFVCENIFYSLLLWFQNCYFHPSLFGLAGGEGPIMTNTMWTSFLTLAEVMFVFLPYYWRPLFPKTALRDAQKNKEKNTKPDNIDFYTKNTLVVKAFYNFAKHFMGFFLNYCCFLSRVPMYGSGHTTIYGLEILSAYMATGQLFIHTLVFKSIVTNKQGAMMYQVGYPFTIFLYYKMSAEVIWRNLDLAIISGIGLALNFLPQLAFFHTYQAVMLCSFFLWRQSFAARPNNDINAENLSLFVQDLKAWVIANPMLTFAAVAFILVGHALPKLAKKNNPFYVWGERFKRERPHPEDDPLQDAKDVKKD